MICSKDRSEAEGAGRLQSRVRDFQKLVGAVSAAGMLGKEESR